MTNRVTEFISNLPGDANHAAVSGTRKISARGRCLDASSDEAAARALSGVERFYDNQARGKQLVSSRIFPGDQRMENWPVVTGSVIL